MDHTVFTIGHSTHPIEKFIDLLKQHSIEAVADVRSSPYSQYNPQYNRETLKKTLQEHEIQYVFLGDELGARRSERGCYVDGQAVYERVAQLPAFREGIERVKKGAQKMRIALMCAEKDPIECHRAVLVSRRLKQEKVDVSHILVDGNVQEHGELEERLLSLSGLQGGDLFRSSEEVMTEAYERRGQQIAYTEKKDGNIGE
jgi:uncharacterized protein (DUF488 family)